MSAPTIVVLFSSAKYYSRCEAGFHEGEGGGYLQWALVYNLKESAKTLMFLQDDGIDSYDELVRRATR
jgi:hypothetical protein